jgi:hypothetical protein
LPAVRHSLPLADVGIATDVSGGIFQGISHSTQRNYRSQVSSHSD